MDKIYKNRRKQCLQKEKIKVENINYNKLCTKIIKLIKLC